MHPDPGLRIRLLGRLELRRDSEPLPPLESSRAASLLAYLLLHSGPQSRQRIAFLLWPDSTEPQARTNLRHVLHTLRRGLPDPGRYLDVTPRTLAWRTDAPYSLDVADLERLLDAAAGQPGPARAELLRRAVDGYPGELLEDSYDEWLLAERDRLRQRRLAALADLAAWHESRDEPAEAIRYAERLLRADPLREETYRLLMRAHYARGDRARALRAYHLCASTLERELDVTPAAETQRLYGSLLPRQPSAPATGPPLVGRGRERARLTATWRDVMAGQAGMLMVTGEPGIGKTRLVEEFARWCRHRGAAVADARCYPAEGVLAYAPVVAWLRSGAIRPQLDRLDSTRLTELVRLLPELPAEIRGLAAPLPLPESEQRQRLFDAVGAALLAAPGSQLLVVDDVQWCDPHTLRFLHYLLRVASGARLLVAATARREDLDEQHPLHQLTTGLRLQDRIIEVELTRLTAEETATLAGHVAGASLPADEARRLHRETEGNPLFVVETVRSGSASPKVQAVIEARLARLSGPARDLVGLAATVGRQFTGELLAAASDATDVDLVRGLDELWRRRILREQGPDGYDFSHQALRDAAYRRLSPARRRGHHLRVAEALRRGADPSGVLAGQVAGHYERAGATDQAVDWYADAARQAQLLHAGPEAVRLLDRALDLLATRPESRDRWERELALRTALPAPLAAIEGYAGDRVRTEQRRALDLVAALGVAPAPPLLRSLGIVALTRADHEAAQRYGEQLLAAGRRDGDEMLVVEASYVLGIAAFWQARFAAARRHFEVAVRRYRPQQRERHLLRYGQDPKVVCLSRLGNTLWFLGEPEAAAAARDAALRFAEQAGDPYGRAVALVFAAVLALDMADHAALRRYTDTLAATGDRAPQFRFAAEAFGGLVAVLDGEARAGIRRIRGALDATRDGEWAPGATAMLRRILLAGYQAAGDAKAVRATAERLLASGGGAAVWHPEARRALAAFHVRTG